jgi:hypothetical protein
MEPFHGWADRCPDHDRHKKEEQHIAQPKQQPER